MSAWVSAWAAIIVAVAGGIASWAVARYGPKGSRENALIDQLQEDVAALRERVNQQDSELQSLRLAVVKMQSANAQWAWHSERVEGQVVELGGTPYPRPLALRATKETPGD